MTLDELLKEGERLERAFFYDMDAIPCRHFYEQHGPTLLAVAKAAVEMREALQPYRDEIACSDWRLVTAFDAAVRGDAEKGER